MMELLTLGSGDARVAAHLIMATATKPADMDEYKVWLENERGSAINPTIEGHFDTVAALVQGQFETHAFWLELIDQLPEWDADYRYVHADYALLAGGDSPALARKSFGSFLSKTYRHNVVKNTAWPGEPSGGWEVFPLWYSQVNDIVRTTISAKYLDGVPHLVQEIKALAKKHGLPVRDYYQATMDGYYAAHVYVTPTFSIPDIDFVVGDLEVQVEIQITTQLQEVIKLLIHRYYEEHRETFDFSDLEWQWDHKSEEFSTNYLGHILHYVEGMIVEVRDKQISASAAVSKPKSPTSKGVS